MAKKQKFSAVDEFGFDTELSFPDLDTRQKPGKDDRKPAVKAAKDFAKGTVSGIWDAAKSDTFIKRTIKAALPKGYGTALDLADETTASLRNLYNSSVKEVKPLLNDMKRATNKLLPTSGKFLPKTVQDRLKTWADSADNGATGLSEEAMRHASLQATLGDIFKYQAETGAQQRAEDKADSNIQKSIDNDRANNQLGQLNSMRIAIQRLADYQDRVTVNYQRKSLEVQYRHYFVAMDSLAEQKMQGAKNRELLENIQKNTALPDFLKIKMREDWPTLMKNKFLSNVGGMVLGQRSAFMRNLTGQIKKSVTKNLSSFVGNAQMAMSIGDMMPGDMGDMGGPSGAEMAGNFAGGLVGDSLGGKFGRWAGKKLRGSKLAPHINKYGNRAQYYAGNAPQHAVEWAHSDHGDELPFGIGNGVRWLKEQVRSANGVQTGMHVDNMRNLQEAAPFTGLARKSLTEIIPGYLARIYRELQILRTGDTKTELTTFDLNSSKFRSKSETSKRAFDSLVKSGDKDWVQDHAKRLVDDLEKGSGVKLNEAQRKALTRRMMKDNLQNRTGSAKRYSDVWNYQGEDAKHAATFSKLFGNYFADDKDSHKQMAFQERFAGLGRGMADNRAAIQDLINSGMLDFVREAGLVDEHGRMDLDQMMDYYLHGEYEPTPDLAGGRLRARGAAGGHGIHASMAGRHRGAPQVKRATKSRRRARHPFPVSPLHMSTMPVSAAGSADIWHEALSPGERAWVAALHESGLTLPSQSTAPNAGGPASRASASGVSPGQKPLGKGDACVCAEQLGTVVEAIKENSTKPIAEKIHEALLAIQKKIEEGLDVRHDRSGVGDGLAGAARSGVRRAKGLLNWTLGDLGGAAVDAGKWGVDQVTGAAKKAKDWVLTPSGILSEAKGWASAGLDSMRMGGKRALGYARTFDDIYLPGVKEPALLAWKMRAGHYRDKATGEIIQSYKDIKGDVIDIFDNDNIVLETKDIGRAFSKSKVGQKAITVLGAAGKALKGAYDTVAGGVFALAPKVLSHGIQLAQKGLDLLDQPVDIYVKGKDDPVMLAIMMRAGAYRSQINGKPITRPSLIDGPVEDISDKNNPVLVLTKEDLAKGLVDRNGRPLKTPLAKLWAMAKQPFEMAFGGIRKGLGMAKNLISAPFKAIGNWFENWLGKDGIIFAGSRTMIDRLTEIRDLLKERLPQPKKRVIGDEEGTGRVTNSWEDKQAKAKEAEKEKRQRAGDSGVDGVASGKGILSGLGGLLSKLRGKKDDKEKDEKGGLLDDAESAAETSAMGWAGSKLAKAGKWAWRGGKQLIKGGARRLLGRGAMAAGEAGIGGAAAEGAAVAGAEGLATAGAAAAGAGEAAVGAGALATMAEVLGVGIAGLGAFIASPVVLAGAAIAVAGLGMYASYKGIKRFFGRKLQPLSKVRFAQYGFLPDENDELQAVFGLEDTLMKAVTYDGNTATIDQKKLKIEDVIKGFDIDTTSKKEVTNWITWYQERFKPVFLTHLSILRGIRGDVPLDAVDDKLKKEEKQKYLKGVSWPAGPYDMYTSPFHHSMLRFHSAESLKAGPMQVRQFIAEAQQAIDKEAGDKGETRTATGGAAGAAAGAAVGATVIAGAVKPGESGSKGQKQQESKSDKAKALVLSALGIGTAKAAESGVSGAKVSATYAVDPSLTKQGQQPGKLETLVGVRYKTYGLKELDPDKCNALRALEAETFKAVRVKATAVDAQAQFMGDVEAIQAKLGAQFGVVGQRNNRAYEWDAWFNLRFLPTYLNFVGSMAKMTGKNDPSDALLVPIIASKLAKQLVGTRSPNGKSVWEVTRSPWANYSLNTDQSSVEAALELLDTKSKSRPVSDGTGVTTSKPKSADKKPDDKKDKTPASVPKKDGGKGWTDTLSDKLQSGWKGIKDWASNAWDNASSGVSDMVNKGVDYVKNTDAYKAAAGAVNTGISAAKSAGQWIEKTYSASAQAIKDALLKAMAAAGIKTPQEQAMFMAQMDHESGGFKSLKENLHYSAANLMKTFGKKHFPTMDAAQSAVQGGERAIADAAYGGRMGNTEADDGYKYRGRGVVQLTGKANYARYGKLIGVDLVSNPDLAAEPATAAKLAIAYWKDRVKGAGTSGDVRAATLAINGGLNGLSSREAKYQQYLQQAQAGKLVPSGGAAPGTDMQTTDTNASGAGSGQAGGTQTADGAGNSAGGDVKTAASDTGSGGTKNPIGMPVSDTSSGTAGKDAIKTASAGGIIPAAAPTGGNSPLSSVTDSPFGFGGSSAKPIATGTRNIMAVQQAQHDAHMDAVGGVGDTLDKSLKVHEDTLDTLKAILAVMKSQGKTARDDSSADASAAQPNSTPAAVPRGPRQDMPKSPVSMRKMV